MRSKGILSKTAAENIGYPHLAGQTVEYELLDGTNNNKLFAAFVYHHGKRIAAVVPIGTDDGIAPIDG